MVEAGLDVPRLNFSHGDLEVHAENAERVRAAASAAGRQVAILQDLPGPKLRIGALQDDLAELRRGEALVLLCGSSEEGKDRRRSFQAASSTCPMAGSGSESMRSAPATARSTPRSRSVV